MPAPSHDVAVLLIGAGMSSLGLACQLHRKYGLRDVELIEKGNDVGGTWRQNTYPGCGCDVPSVFYSYSWEQNPDWTFAFSLQPEIQQYFRNIAIKYGVLQRIRFGHEVLAADWDTVNAHWTVRIRDLGSGRVFVRKAKVLVSGVGGLSVPKDCDIPGADTFNGHLFHSAQWDHTFDWSNKDVVVLGNGCSATQFVPVMARTGSCGESPPVRKLTQFVRSSHWLMERPNPRYTATDKALFRYIPFYQHLIRLHTWSIMERDFAGFDIDSGAPIRKKLMEDTERYMRRMAPERYADFLVPKFEFGCKRKVMDTDYLETLHRPNVELIYDDPVVEIQPTGVRTRSGKQIPADAIVRATGFATHKFLYPMEVRGAGGKTLQEFWDKETQGAAQAYMGTCVADFPNFFILMGPNTVTGHTSVIHTVELQTSLVLRLLEPLIASGVLHTRSTTLASPLSLFTLKPIERALSPPVHSIVNSDAAFASDTRWTQARSSRLVWTVGGCTSWAIDPNNKYQVTMYPDWQWKLWLRTVFIKWGDWEFRDLSGRRLGGWRVSSQRALAKLARAVILGLILKGMWVQAKQKGWVEMIRHHAAEAFRRAGLRP